MISREYLIITPMKYLLILILVGAMGFSIYKQREEIAVLKADLDSSRQQIESLQQARVMPQQQVVQAAVAQQQSLRGASLQPASLQPSSAQPSGQTSNPQSGSWMWNSQPMDHPMPAPKKSPH